MARRHELSRLGLLEQVTLFGRFAHALPAWLSRKPPDGNEVRATVRRDLACRGERLLRIVERGILPFPQSPYARLLGHAGIGMGDLAQEIDRHGLECALEILHREGVYVTLNEFKGRVPVVRGSLRFHVTSHDFDNPLGAAHYAVESGGSRSKGTRIAVDLAHNERCALYDYLLLETHGLLARPYVVYQPTLPYSAGINALLRYARIGQGSPPRWFSQNRIPGPGKAWQHGAMTRLPAAQYVRHGRVRPHRTALR